jgi:hypothetical protein
MLCDDDGVAGLEDYETVHALVAAATVDQDLSLDVLQGRGARSA